MKKDTLTNNCNRQCLCNIDNIIYSCKLIFSPGLHLLESISTTGSLFKKNPTIARSLDPECDSTEKPIFFQLHGIRTIGFTLSSGVYAVNTQTHRPTQ